MSHNNSKGYNISLQATAKMGGALFTTPKGNRALLLPIDGFTVVEKEGKAYINLTAWISEDADQYGNQIGIQERISKERSDAKEKAQYVGNGKQFYPKVEAAPPVATPVASKPAEEDDLPF